MAKLITLIKNLAINRWYGTIEIRFKDGVPTVGHKTEEIRF